MAKQVGPLFFTGTVEDLIFYKLGDNYFMRSKGSYKSGKQMRKDPTYKRTLQQADRFGEASNLLKAVYYRYLPKAARKHGLYGKLTGLINKWLYQGKNKEEVRELLIAHCQQLAATVTTTATKEQPEKVKLPVNVPQPYNIEQRPTGSEQPSSLTTSGQHPLNAEHRSMSNAQRSTKKPRYLSHWKVKRNGRLHIPQSAD